MKIKCFLLSALLIPGFLFAQQKFTIDLEAPSFINDSIILAPLYIRKGFEELYNFKIDSNDNINNFGKKFGIESAFFQVKIKDKNIIGGHFRYPQPFLFQYYNKKDKKIYRTSIFFLDAGSYKINLPAMFNSYEVNLNSPVNKEYADFKKLFSDLYVKIDNGLDSLTNLTKKEERIGSYIKTHADSYVAFWEIVNDYSFHNYNAIYLRNLQLFSGKIKETEIFKIVEEKLNAEKITRAGSEFPDIRFDKQHALTKEDFKKYKLTFIDCWSTTCEPCIAAMPRIAAMYNKYKDKGINFITVTDENQPKKIEFAQSILSKNNITWANYFDINKDFKNKVNVTGYPLQFLVDENGKIITRVTGNLNEIERIIDQKVK